ncbi:GNL3L/Grn1 putative GTPase-domain-containing protein [Gongronella butleri]|nr:GNL3L/Grn1 putative GTPase-domain-containing protein [Gongronella butleri]
MVPKKYKSKRGTLKQKYSIQAKAKQHKKKEARAAKKNPGQFKRKAKDPGIPNSWPFKEELLNEIERHRQDAEEEKKKLKALRIAQSKKAREANKKSTK